MDGFIETIVGESGEQDRAASNQPHTALTLETAQQLSQKLDQQLQASQKALQKLIEDNAETYAKAQQEVVKVQDSITKLLDGVDELQAKLGDAETGIQARLDTAMQDREHKREQFTVNSAILQCLRQLSGINEGLREMDFMIRGDRLDEAALKLLEIEEALGGIEELEGTRVADILRNRLQMARVNIKERALQALHMAITVEVGQHEALLSAQPETNTGGLFAALDSVADNGETCQAFNAYIVDAFVKPVLSVPSLAPSDKGLDTDFGVRLNREGSETEASQVSEIILQLVEFIKRRLGDRAWTDRTLVEITQLVLHRCFLKRIPETRADLEAFDKVVAVLSDFESSLLGQCVEPPAEMPIQNAVNRLDELFIEQQCFQALAQARKLAQSTTFAIHGFDDHEVWSVEFLRGIMETANTQLDTSLERWAEEQGSCWVFPRCVVSESMVSAICKMYWLINESAQCTREELGDRLKEAARYSIDVYLALFPVVHRQQLRRVPALSWQFHNDCLYAAHHVAILAKLSQDHMDQWTRTAQAALKRATTQATAIIDAESRELTSLIDSNVFYSASETAQKQQLEHMHKQVQLAVTQLCAGMKPPALTPQAFYRACGSYLDAVFAATVEGVIGVSDISADDSQVLSDHCHLTLDLSAHFKLDTLDMYRTLTSEHDEHDVLWDSDDDEEGDRECARLTRKHCGMADKLKQLADILVISRADILARRRAGLLYQFSTSELVSLVKALFSDTFERARDIDELKNI
ncbi:Centromere/kinetochore protein zw10 [Coemansia sp. RSA 2336]|nr:Centromere/kinetochore protein zw10 [Coemansia sp. RSA 2336]